MLLLILNNHGVSVDGHTDSYQIQFFFGALVLARFNHDGSGLDTLNIGQTFFNSFLFFLIEEDGVPLPIHVIKRLHNLDMLNDIVFFLGIICLVFNKIACQKIQKCFSLYKYQCVSGILLFKSEFFILFNILITWF